MYEQYGLSDPFFLMLYGGTMMLALTECCYMLVALRSILAPQVVPPRGLRYWTAAFFAAVAASHLWWAILGIVWLKDDRLTRNIITIMLDYITLVPLVMAVLLSMLQDRKRMLWPFFVAHIPIIGIAGYGLIAQSPEAKDYMFYYQVGIIVIFIIYYVRALIQYGRWLRENYADLENKEVWHSLLFLAVILAFYYAYTSNLGELFHEYLSQVNTLIILIFLSWRVETLQMLSPSDTDVVSTDITETPSVSANTGLDIGSMLQNHCEDTRLYLRHDLTLSELAVVIGTNRTYLSSYFSQQGDTYNAYINRLRIDHFIQLYHEAVSQSRPVTALELSHQCGYRTYRTFSTAFRQHMGVTVTAWMLSERSVLHPA
jgi:AraC-like DNA-binding protein